MIWQPVVADEWKAQRRGSLSDVKDIVSGIIEDVRTNGDAALFALTEKFDKQKLETLKITQ